MSNDITHITLGSLLSSTNEIIKRNALSILKQIQRGTNVELRPCTQCGYEKAVLTHYKSGNYAVLVSETCDECGYEWNRPFNP